jgi:hypothetical protein
MRLRYGLSENQLWRDCMTVDDVAARIREVGAQIVRLSVEDECTENESWRRLETYLTGVLAAGAVPMVTFSKFGRPYADNAAIRWFAGCASDLVRRSIDRWGPEIVREWLWCVGNEPNSEWRNAGLTVDRYRGLYEAAAESIVECLAPYLEGRRALVGGPGIDGFQPFWIDWVYRFVNEFDNRLISFVVWHRYGEWRQAGDWGAPKEEAIFRALVMSRCAEYQARSRAVGRMLKGRGILNVCGEFNAHSDLYSSVSEPFNRSEFGAAYYGSVLIHLIRGGADIEMLRSAPGATPQHMARQLCARFIRAGDDLDFPELPNAQGRADIVIATSPDHQLSAFLVHRRDEPFTLSLRDVPVLEQCQYVLKIDTATKGKIVRERLEHSLRIEGYGVAVLSGAEARVQ